MNLIDIVKDISMLPLADVLKSLMSIPASGLINSTQAVIGALIKLTHALAHDLLSVMEAKILILVVVTIVYMLIHMEINPSLMMQLLRSLSI